jgi:two-component system response regulator HydG
LLSEESTIDVEVLEALAGPPGGLDARQEIDRMARSLLALPDRLGSKLDMIERAVLHHAIESCGGNKSAAARLIGVDRKALERRWERLSDSAPDSDPSTPPPGSRKGD